MGSNNSRQAPAPSTFGHKNQGLCNYCHLKPKHVHGKTTYDYCGQTCRFNAQNARASVPTPLSPSMAVPALCIVCHSKPQHWDGVKLHPYCSKACAGKRKPAAVTPVTPQCTFPGCAKPVWIDQGTGVPSSFCSTTHRNQAGGGRGPIQTVPAAPPAVTTANACIFCHVKPTNQSSGPFCTPCVSQAQLKAPCIIEVPHGHDSFSSVSSQFKASWRHRTKCPTIQRVYKIMSTPASMANYETYRSSVEARGNWAPHRSAGNENRRWHGTTRACSLGEPGNTNLCSSPSCSLCCIIRTSFDLGKAGAKTGYGRFGHGIYTSSTSSKSNDYSSNISSSTTKAMLLNKVVVGKPVKLKKDDPTLVAPPAGYDSVIGEPGGNLNYDELIVYNSDAVRPSYLLVYGS